MYVAPESNVLYALTVVAETSTSTSADLPLDEFE